MSGQRACDQVWRGETRGGCLAAGPTPECVREAFFLEVRIEFFLVALFFFLMGGVCEREKEREKEKQVEVLTQVIYKF